MNITPDTTAVDTGHLVPATGSTRCWRRPSARSITRATVPDPRTATWATTAADGQRQDVLAGARPIGDEHGVVGARHHRELVSIHCWSRETARAGSGTPDRIG